MTPETINSIKEALAPVAEKIGQGAEYGWEILVWGQFAEGVGTLAVFATAIIAYLVLWRVLYKAAVRSQEDALVGTVLMFGTMILLFISTFFLVEGYEAIIQIVAPEYAALKFLIGTVK